MLVLDYGNKMAASIPLTRGVRSAIWASSLASYSAVMALTNRTLFDVRIRSASWQWTALPSGQRCGMTLRELLNKQHPNKGLSEQPDFTPFHSIASCSYSRLLRKNRTLCLCVSRIWHANLLAGTTDRRDPAHTVLGVQLDCRCSTFDHTRVVHDTDLDDPRITKSLALSPEGRAAVTAETRAGQLVCPIRKNGSLP